MNPTRKEIELNWQRKSDVRGSGTPLCSYIYCHTTLDLETKWRKIWDKVEAHRNVVFMSEFFCVEGYVSDDDHLNKSYLLRALSLNMLLDDNDIK